MRQVRAPWGPADGSPAALENGLEAAERAHLGTQYIRVDRVPGGLD